MSGEGNHVAAMFTCIVAGDMAGLRGCFAPGAVVWHNDVEAELHVDAVVEVLSGLCAATSSLAYENQVTTQIGRLHFIQHVLCGDLVNGGVLRMPAMMRVETDDAGLVTRIDEYYDSRATDCLMG